MPDLQKQIDEIQARNRRVEADKAWETSWTRKIVVFILTYIVIAIVFLVAELPEPFLNAIIPAVAFVLSTATIPVAKKIWIKRQKNL